MRAGVWEDMCGRHRCERYTLLSLPNKQFWGMGMVGKSRMSRASNNNKIRECGFANMEQHRDAMNRVVGINAGRGAM